MKVYTQAEFAFRGEWMRHSETLAWLQGIEVAPGTFVFETPSDPGGIFVPGTNDTDFEPTHVHYKGGLYRVRGHGLLEGTEMTVYSDGHGNTWVRPRAMFEESMPDGRPRFAPFKLPRCA